MTNGSSIVYLAMGMTESGERGFYKNRLVLTSSLLHSLKHQSSPVATIWLCYSVSSDSVPRSIQKYSSIEILTARNAVRLSPITFHATGLGTF